MLRRNVSCCFVPRVAVKVANHPDIVHSIAGADNLLMALSVANCAEAAVLAFENIVAVKAGAEALRFVEAVVIYLRLRVGVRGIARPAARLIEYLAQNHI